MNPYSLLLDEARRKRDDAIARARAEYRQAVIEIDRLGRKLNGTGRKNRYTASLRGDGSTFSSMTTTRAAEEVLRACGPMTITEIALEVQRRGCRATEPPRTVAHTIRSALAYHSERFVRGDDGKWAVVV